MQATTDIAAQLRDLRQNAWAAQTDALDRRALAWLALLPAWPRNLAESVGFPFGSHSPDTFVELAAERGLCEMSTDGALFWMPDAQRDEVLERLADDRSVSLLQEAATLGQRVDKMAGSVPTISSPVARWAALAARLDRSDALSAGAADWLSQHLRGLVERGDTAEALAWIETGTTFVGLFGGALETALRLGERGLEVLYRRERDARYLRSFLPRNEQIDAFRHLLASDSPTWALHYLGVGGVGKTMLLRYLTSTLADEEGVLTSRIDFDYISPDFPARRPGQLFFELGDELRLHAQSGIYERFRYSAQHLHELLSTEPLSQDPVAQLQREPLKSTMQSMVESFSSFLRTTERRVVLVLDTCEELAKYQPSGTRLPSVEVTFYLLEQLHAVLPSLRVVFAGRRLLSQAGAGWQASPEYRSGGNTMLPGRKEYLALHTIRGFTTPEARRFLCSVKQVPISSPRVYRAALSHSREVGASAGISGGSSEPLRFNPFDLDLFANWLIDEPGLTPDRIASGRQDPYIDRRILDRLQPDLRRLLPAVTLLGRMDEVMLQPLQDQDPKEAHRLFRTLGEQEWIGQQRDEALSTVFLSVHPGLLRRLRDYYSRDEARRQQLDAAGAVLGPALAESIRTTRLRALSIDLIDAALRLNPDQEGAGLWSELERRIPKEADWAWALTITTRLLGTDGAVGSERHPLRAGLEATLASALIHQQPDHDLRPNWASVEDVLPRFPDSEIRTLLRLRVVAGRLAAMSGSLAASPKASVTGGPGEMVVASSDPRDNQAILAGALRDLLNDVDVSNDDGHQLVASYLAATAAVLDVTEATDPAAVQLETGSVLWDLARRCEEARLPNEFTAFAYLLAARAAALLHEGPLRIDRSVQPGTLFRYAAAQIDDGFQADANRWYDWVPPRLMKFRVLLESLRAHPPKPDEPEWEAMREWQEQASSAIDDIDAERLLSCIGRLRLAYAPLSDPLNELFQGPPYDPARRSRCLAHHAVPPLAITSAENLLARGRAAEARTYLMEHRSAATRYGRDKDTVDATTRAMVRILRRSRMRHERTLLVAQIKEATADSYEARETALLCGVAVDGQMLQARDITPRSPDQMNTAPPRLDALRRLERAEVLAVSQPAHAVSELETAREAFSSADDAVGVFQASVLAALARARAEGNVSSETLGSLYSAYEAVRLLFEDMAANSSPPVVEPLPEWSELEAAAKRILAPTNLPYPDHPDLGQWLRRLLLVLATAEVRDASDGNRIQDWLAAEYRQEIPPEMLPNTVLPGDDAEPLRTARPAPASGLKDLRARLIIRNVITTAIGLVFLGGVLYGGYWLFVEGLRLLLTQSDHAIFGSIRTLLGWPGPGHAYILIPLYIVTLFALTRIPAVYDGLRGAMQALWQKLRASYIADSWIALRVRMERAGEATFQLHVIPSVRGIIRLYPLPMRRSLLPRLARGGNPVVNEAGPAPGLDPHLPGGGRPPELNQALVVLREMLGKRSVPVQLDLQESSLHAAPWEALFGINEDDESTMPAIPDRLRPWRSARGAERRVSDEAKMWESGAVCYVGGSAWRLMAKSAWEGVGSSLQMYPVTAQSYKVLYAMGTAIRTSAGLRLQVTESERQMKQAQSSSAQGRSGTILAAADLPEVVLIVIQGDLTDMPLRTRSEREQAALARMYAAEAAEQGARAVLVLPGLPLPLTETVLKEIARRLPRSVPELSRLLDITHRIRNTIAGWQPPDAASPNEDLARDLALDVCLYYVP